MNQTGAAAPMFDAAEIGAVTVAQEPTLVRRHAQLLRERLRRCCRPVADAHRGARLPVTANGRLGSHRGGTWMQR